MKVTIEGVTVKCPNCGKALDKGTFKSAGAVRKATEAALIDHLPKCSKRGDALMRFRDAFGSAGRLGTTATLFKLLHEDDQARQFFDAQ